MKCSKKHYRKYKCKRCGNTSNHVGGECWRLYNICGECYRKEMFPKKYGQYRLCKSCGDYIVRAFTNKNGITIHLPYRVCVTCRIIYVENHNYKVEPLE